jgi:hypothetical protein
MLAKRSPRAKRTTGSRSSGSTSSALAAVQKLRSRRTQSEWTRLLFSLYVASSDTYWLFERNTDYQAEHGASRNFEPWREQSETTEEDRLAKLEEEEDNPMQALEAKTVDAKREMDILDKLQEIRTRNARFEKIDREKVLQTVSSRAEVVDDEAARRELWKDEEQRRQEEEDEAEVRRVFGKIASAAGPLGGSKTGEAMPSIELDEPIDETTDGDAQAGPSSASPPTGSSGTPEPQSSVTVKRKLVDVEPEALSLLSEEAQKVAKVDWVSTVAAGKKRKEKKSAELAQKLGIKIGVKGKAKSKA